MGPFQIQKIASFAPHFTVGFCVFAFLGLAFGQKPFREFIPMEGAASSSILPSDYRNKSELVSCVVVSPDDMNAHLRTAIVAPMTTGSRPARFRIALTFQGKQGLVLLDQLRTLDGVRLVKRLGALRPTTLALTLQTLRAMFA